MPERRSLINVINNNAVLAKSWQPEAIEQTRQQIQEQVSSSAEIQVPFDSIHLGFSFTPTKLALRYHYDPEQIAQWAEADIKQNGILSPLWVRPLPNSNGNVLGYELVAGMRRYLAAKHLKLETLPVKVFQWSDEQAYQAAASENFNRKNFTPIEELDHILHFLSRSLGLAVDEVPPLLNRMSNAAKGNIDPEFLSSQQAQTVQKIFDTLGQMSWKTFVQSRLRLRNQPPEIIATIREGKLSYPKAIAIAQVKDETARIDLINQAVQEKLTLEDITTQANLLKQPPSERLAVEQTEEQEFKFRTSAVLKRVRSSKLNPKVRGKLEKLLKQIEELLETSES